MSTRIGPGVMPVGYVSEGGPTTEGSAPEELSTPLGPVNFIPMGTARTPGALANAMMALRPLPTVYDVGPGQTVADIYSDLSSRGLSLDRNTFETRLRFNHPGIDLFALTPGQRLSFGSVEARAPNAAELVKSPIVRKTIEQAWVDSQTWDPALRHEEGGWIYMNVKSGQVFTHRHESGAVASIDLTTPPQYVDSVIVGTFHTHPHPSGDGWVSGPSDSDILMDNSRGVPGIIRNDQGYQPYAWNQRVSLSGTWAYPGTPERPLG